MCCDACGLPTFTYITCMCLCVYLCIYACVSVDTISVVVEWQRVGQTVCAAMRVGCPLSRRDIKPGEYAR